MSLRAIDITDVGIMDFERFIFFYDSEVIQLNIMLIIVSSLSPQQIAFRNIMRKIFYPPNRLFLSVNSFGLVSGAILFSLFYRFIFIFFAI
jgi:hypothetical protein